MASYTREFEISSAQYCHYLHIEGFEIGSYQNTDITVNIFPHTSSNLNIIVS